MVAPGDGRHICVDDCPLSMLGNVQAFICLALRLAKYESVVSGLAWLAPIAAQAKSALAFPQPQPSWHDWNHHLKPVPAVMRTTQQMTITVLSGHSLQVHEYEQLMSRVQPVFKPLLKPHLEDMEKKIAPGMFILTWASMNIDGYLHRFKQVCCYQWR